MLLSYLPSFLAGILLSAVLSRYVREVAIVRGVLDAPDRERHIHITPVPRLGGVAIFLSFTIVLGADQAIRQLLGVADRSELGVMLRILGPALIVFLTGLYDDLRSLGVYWKFGAQSLAAAMLYLGGFGVHRIGLFSSGGDLPVAVSLPLTILWVVLITNAFNLVDGLDGLAAGSALFSTMVIFVVSLRTDDHWISLLTLTLAGAILGFLRFNFHPALIFLGDSGSLSIGFILSALALAGPQKAPTMVAVAVPVVSLGLPILDVTITVFRRFLSGKSLFKADCEHVHHRLLKRGLSQREAVLILYGVSAVFGLLSLALLHARGTTALVVAVLGIGAFVGIRELRYHEFSELRGLLQRTISQKRVIANNVNIRRTRESLQACKDVSEFCRILSDALRSLEFDGFSLQLPGTVPPPESFPAPLTQERNGELRCSWAVGDPAEPFWELKLGLITSAGDKCGFFSVYKRSIGRPLLADINLLTDGFHVAVADAVHRVILQLAPQQETKEHLPLSRRVLPRQQGTGQGESPGRRDSASL